MKNTIPSQDDDVLVLDVSSEEEARERAASHWGVPSDEVVLKVIEEGKSFFGLFGRKLKIEARRAAPAQPAEPEAASGEDGGDFISLLKRVLKAAQLDLEVNVLADGSVNLSGPDSKILLAGRQSDGLKALDYIVNLMARNNGPVPHVLVDCEGFRRKREKELERIALEAAKEAMKTRRTVYLQPMPSWERRIVHLTLRESSNVETHSIGFEPGRKVAVRLIGSASSSRADRFERSDRRAASDGRRRSGGSSSSVREGRGEGSRRPSRSRPGSRPPRRRRHASSRPAEQSGTDTAE